MFKLIKQKQNKKNIQCHSILLVVDLCENKLSSGDLICHCIS